MAASSGRTSPPAFYMLRPGQIQTMVFMDFEATDLIPRNRNVDKFPVPGDTKRSIAQQVTTAATTADNKVTMPQITELSFLAVPRQVFQRKADELHDDLDFLDIGAPVTVNDVPSNAYYAQVKPQLTAPEWENYEKLRRTVAAMHLSFEDLRYKHYFSEEWPIVHAFLSRLKKPACIIAHNGANFDFRLLYAELVKNKMMEKYPLPEDVYFLDSYMAFLDIERGHFDNLAVTTNTVNWAKVSEAVVVARELSQERSVAAQESTEVTLEIKQEIVPDSQDVAGSADADTTAAALNAALAPPPEVREAGMHTPPRKRKPTEAEESLIKRSRHLFPENEATPMSFLNTANWSPAKRRRTTHKLFEEAEGGNWVFSENTATRFFFGGNFKLENLYQQVTKKTYAAHHAHDDCEALLQVALFYGSDFLKYMDTRREKIPIFHGQ
uniref:Exonuclease domain-containing protein n=1 Tax=Panagrellus redivivus TaxID=6233 RepID=A0A7E4VYP3_PANRE